MGSIRYSENVMSQARKIVVECMGTQDSFCKSSCPMSTDVKEYVRCIREGNYADAIKVIRKKLFLPGTLGRVCAHPCEGECRREKEYKEGIAIAALKRFAADKADKEEDWDITTESDTGKKVAIIGSGPAGAQAAIDLRKAGHAVTIFEKEKKPGGMLQYGIPKYRLPRSVLDREYRYLDMLGIEMKLSCEVGRDISFDALRERYDAVLIAVGAQRGSIVKITGAEGNGVYTALEFLKEVACTEKFPNAGDKILIIGGGDVAMDCARSAVRLGCKKVWQCSLESEDDLPANREEYEAAVEEGVFAFPGWGPEEIYRRDGKIIRIRLRKVTAVFDETGKFAPSYGEEFMELDIDTVIMATGQSVLDVTDGELPQKAGGRYEVNPVTMETGVEGVFAAGDAAGGKIVIEAMALGQKAAISIQRFLSNQDMLAERDLKSEWSYETALNVPLPEGTINQPRVSANIRPVEERILDFEAVDMGLTEEDAQKEASRCLQCECRLCMKECVMLERAGQCPGEIFASVTAGGQLDVLTAYSCNDCEACKKICPKELPVQEILMAARCDIAKENGGKSPLRSHRAVQIQQTMGFHHFYTTKAGGQE